MKDVETKPPLTYFDALLSSEPNKQDRPNQGSGDDSKFEPVFLPVPYLADPIDKVVEYHKY